MKKIITILILVFAGATSFAQYKNYGSNQDRNGVYRRDNDGDRDDKWRNERDRDDRWRNNNYNNATYSNQRNVEIARINQEFDRKVRSIQSNFFLSARQKSIRISEAEAQRNQQIQMVYNNYGRYNNYGGYNQGGYNQVGRNDERYRRDNYNR